MHFIARKTGVICTIAMLNLTIKIVRIQAHVTHKNPFSPLMFHRLGGLQYIFVAVHCVQNHSRMVCGSTMWAITLLLALHKVLCPLTKYISLISFFAVVALHPDLIQHKIRNFRSLLHVRYIRQQALPVYNYKTNICMHFRKM